MLRSPGSKCQHCWFLVRGFFLVGISVPSNCVLMWSFLCVYSGRRGRERETEREIPGYKGISPIGPWPHSNDLINPNYISKASSPNMITLQVRASIYEFLWGEDTNIHSIIFHNIIQGSTCITTLFFIISPYTILFIIFCITSEIILLLYLYTSLLIVYLHQNISSVTVKP